MKTKQQLLKEASILKQKLDSIEKQISLTEAKRMKKLAGLTEALGSKKMSDMDKVAEYLRQKLGDEYADVFIALSEAHPDEDEMEQIALSIPDTKANRLDRELQEIFAEQNAFAISKFTNNKRELNLDMEPFDEDGSLEKLEDIHMAIYSL